MGTFPRGFLGVVCWPWAAGLRAGPSRKPPSLCDFIILPPSPLSRWGQARRKGHPWLPPGCFWGLHCPCSGEASSRATCLRARPQPPPLGLWLRNEAATAHGAWGSGRPLPGLGPQQGAPGQGGHDANPGHASSWQLPPAQLIGLEGGCRERSPGRRRGRAVFSPREPSSEATVDTASHMLLACEADFGHFAK